MVKNKLIVISGASSGGKSTLLDELSKQGYTIIPEIGRRLVKEQLALNGNILPWENPLSFCEMLIERSIAAYHEANKLESVKDQIIFFDRSFLEGVCYYQTLNVLGANKYDQFIREFRYYPIIFMVPPWKEIFCEDDERKKTFENAIEEYERLVKQFPKAGYELVEVPKMSVQERLKFILSYLKATSKNNI